MEDKDGNPLDGSYNLYDEDGIVYFLEDEDGYIVVPEGTEGAITEITPKDGKLNIKGLDPEKSYELHEVTPPTDFPPSDEPIPLDPEEPEITIVDDRDPVEPEPDPEHSTLRSPWKQDGNPLDGSYSLWRRWHRLFLRDEWLHRCTRGTGCNYGDYARWKLNIKV